MQWTLAWHMTTVFFSSVAMHFLVPNCASGACFWRSVPYCTPCQRPAFLELDERLGSKVRVSFSFYRGQDLKQLQLLLQRYQGSWEECRNNEFPRGRCSEKQRRFPESADGFRCCFRIRCHSRDADGGLAGFGKGTVLIWCQQTILNLWVNEFLAMWTCSERNVLTFTSTVEQRHVLDSFHALRLMLYYTVKRQVEWKTKVRFWLFRFLIDLQMYHSLASLNTKATAQSMKTTAAAWQEGSGCQILIERRCTDILYIMKLGAAPMLSSTSCVRHAYTVSCKELHSGFISDILWGTQTKGPREVHASYSPPLMSHSKQLLVPSLRLRASMAQLFFCPKLGQDKDCPEQLEEVRLMRVLTCFQYFWILIINYSIIIILHFWLWLIFESCSIKFNPHTEVHMFESPGSRSSHCLLSYISLAARLPPTAVHGRIPTWFWFLRRQRVPKTWSSHILSPSFAGQQCWTEEETGLYGVHCLDLAAWLVSDQ